MKIPAGSRVVSFVALSSLLVITSCSDRPEEPSSDAGQTDQRVRGSGTTKMKNIDEEGGEIEVGDMKLSVPPDAI